MSDDLAVRGLHGAATPADAVAEVARCEAALDAVSGYERKVRDCLELKLRAIDEQAGSQTTLRADAGTAYIAGGNVKVRVSDPDAFGAWADESLPGDVVAMRAQVDVTDHEAAASLIWKTTDMLEQQVDDEALRRRYGNTVAGYLVQLLDCLTVTNRWHIADDAVDALTADGTLVPNADTGRVHWSETGEAVPGLTAERTRETLTVRPDSKLRARLRGQFEAALPQLGDGGA